MADIEDERNNSTMPKEVVLIPEEDRTRYAALVKEFDGTEKFRLGQYAPFKKFQADLREKGFKACANLTCPHGVQPLANFNNRAASTIDGKAACCKSCSKPLTKGFEKAARNKRKLEIAE